MAAFALSVNTLVLVFGTCSELSIDARVEPDLRTIRGVATCRVSTDGPVFAACYPRVLREPTGLDDVTRHWFYPHGFSPADMQVSREGTPLDSAGPWQPLGDFRAGEMVKLEFVTRVPERNGTLGWRRDVLYALGGWHPAFGRDRAIPKARMTYSVSVPEGSVGLVGNRRFGRGPPGRVTGQFAGRFLPLLVAKGVQTRVTDGAVVLWPESPRLPAREDDFPYGLPDISSLGDEPAREELARTLSEGTHFARRFMADLESLVVVIAPLREHLVERFDGGLAVSDRAFHLLDWERFLKFHRLSVWREQLAALATPHAEQVETSLPAELVADAVGAALRDRLAVEHYSRKEFAPDILESVDVIPEIDSLIYAPQVQFVDTYFEAIDETPTARRRLDDFYHDLPRGKLLYEKLADLVWASAAQQIVDDYLSGGRPFLAVGGGKTGRDLESALAPWLGPYPRLDYALGEVESTAQRIRVSVESLGSDASRMHEPVTVEVVDRTGQRVRARREGPGTVAIDAPGPPERVTLDPDGRLVELAHEPGKSPRFNDHKPARWRLLLNNITGLVAVTAEQLTLSADVSLKRIHDLTYRYDFVARFSPFAIGAAAGASYGFGREVTPLAMAQRVGIALAYDRLRVEHGAQLPGDLASLTAYYGYDDRLSPYWAFEGKGLSLRVSGAAGSDVRGHRYGFVQAGVSGFAILPLGFGHALLGRLGADIMTGAAPAQQGFRLGGRYRGARGFDGDEARSDRRLIASAEYRHVVWPDIGIDLGGLVYWTRLEGALFADAVYLPVRRTGCRRDSFFDLGYGVRFIGDALNVSPSSIALDIGLPIGRCSDEAGRAPVTVYLAFIQSFSAF